MLLYGEGSYDWHSVYFTMPIHIRRFYYMKLAEKMKKEDAAANNTNQTKPKSNKNRRIKPPNQIPFKR